MTIWLGIVLGVRTKAELGSLRPLLIMLGCWVVSCRLIQVKLSRPVPRIGSLLGAQPHLTDDRLQVILRVEEEPGVPPIS
jgi:hypothetical protein